MLVFGFWMLSLTFESSPQQLRHQKKRQSVGGPAAPKILIERSPTFPNGQKTTSQNPHPPLRTPTSNIEYPTSRPNSSRPRARRSSQSSRSHPSACDGAPGFKVGDVSLWILDGGSRVRKSPPTTSSPKNARASAALPRPTGSAGLRPAPTVRHNGSAGPVKDQRSQCSSNVQLSKTHRSVLRVH